MNRIAAGTACAAVGAGIAFILTYTIMQWKIDDLRAVNLQSEERAENMSKQLSAALDISGKMDFLRLKVDSAADHCRTAEGVIAELLALAKKAKPASAPAPSSPAPTPPRREQAPNQDAKFYPDQAPAPTRKPAVPDPKKVEYPVVAQDKASRMLDALNSVRAEHDLPPLEWSKKLMDSAGAWAQELIKDCERDLTHDQAWDGGENLAKGYRTPEAAVAAWAGEEKDYDYSSNTCADGKMCGHYTQIVQRDAKEVGCQQIKCSDGKPVLVCRWDVGNIAGKKPF